MKLSALLQNIEVETIVGNKDTEIQSIAFDSRKVGKGTLFAAIKGTASDGHDYIEKAIAAGANVIVHESETEKKQEGITYVRVKDSAEALALLSSNFYGNPSRKLTLVGVTGTNGKTTTATLLYQLLRRFGHKAGLLSTVVNYVDDEAVPATHTTPDPIALNELLARMVEAHCEYAFMEVSSHSIVQKRIGGLDFDGGIFTNITRDHIDYHKTFDNYLKAKKAFFDNLKKEAFAVTNLDDKNGLQMLANCRAAHKTYSTRSAADFKGRILEEDFDGMMLNINNNEIHVPFIGRFNVYNLLAVFGTAVCLGLDPQESLRHISALRAVSGRFETIRAPKGYTAIVDYAHTPDALQNVLATINDIRLLRRDSGRLIAVVGCGGDRDKGKRPMMAKEAVNGADQVILTSDNPRHEDPEAILNDMLAGLDEEDRRKTLVITDRRQAIRTACTLAQAKDVILVAGKGHEDYQIIGDVKHHFDDHEEIRSCF
ncbi:MAG: UDP-N-acetylmuramoyl-L-alanyl-D-glutamate--2,6-diaminopimelate ligase [Paludibacteraceae bacterium]|nr:UDP-N-acetylmuramoyl-L-alanyl-D-glutamate--2,6-diaminopimelate ligase [Paludibacteraceae bacterium]